MLPFLDVSPINKSFESNKLIKFYANPKSVLIDTRSPKSLSIAFGS